MFFHVMTSLESCEKSTANGRSGGYSSRWPHCTTTRVLKFTLYLFCLKHVEYFNITTRNSAWHVKWHFFREEGICTISSERPAEPYAN